MYSGLRRRLLLALSLTCVSLPAACKKDDGEATGVDNEGIKKKKKPRDPDEPKPVKTWILDGSAKKAGPCDYVHFCTTGRPKVAFPWDSSALAAECGGTVKIPKAAVIEGFTEDHNASFIEHVTKEQRDEKDPAACCYGYSTGPCGKGRPLRDGEHLVLAPEVARAGWAGVDVAEAARDVLSSGEAEAFVAHFRRVARLEHGSVAAFASVSLDLLALGAPATLVEAAHVAALDEIRHARACFSLVEAITGAPVGPGPMTIPARKPVDVERILVETVIEGCVGETLGSLLFEEAARRCASPALAAIYRTIAEEEASHAALAFRIARFLIDEDPRRAEVALAAALRATREPVSDTAIDALGLIDRASQREVFDRGFDEVVMPTLVALAA